MTPDINTGWEQVGPVGRAIEEEGRIQTQVFAPRLKHERRIYRAPRVIVRARPTQHELAHRPRLKQVATVVERPVSHPTSKSLPISVATPPNPITQRLASLPPHADVPSVPIEAAQPPSAAPLIQMHASASATPQIETEIERLQIDPDAGSSVLVPVPLPKALDEQIPKASLVKQLVDAALKYLVRVASNESLPIPAAAPSNPVSRLLASPPSLVDAPTLPIEAVHAAPPIQVREPDSAALKNEKQTEGIKIGPDEPTTRMADIPLEDVRTLNEPGPSVPLPVPLPKDLDEQIPKENLVKQLVDAARSYLIRIACPGDSMTRQGEDLAIGRIHPVFAVRMAAAIKQARREGLPGACPFSTYRPPAFGIGGYSNKYDSMHAYGLAADMSGIGRPGSRQALTWWRVAHENGLYLPYGPYNHAEWNHTQLLHQKGRQFVETHRVRRTIAGYGPIDVMAMWVAAGVDMLKVTPDQPTKEVMPRAGRRVAHHARRHRRVSMLADERRGR